jgi:hypothetical protein
MANKTIYIADEDTPIFQRAQEVAGESISKVIVQALRQYLVQKDLEGTELKECEAMAGVHDGFGLRVEKVRFIGRLLSTVKSGTEYGEESYTFTLYYTRKGKFLLQVRTEYLPDISHEVDYSYEIIDDFTKLCARGLPSKLIKEAEEKLGRSEARFLDI